MQELLPENYQTYLDDVYANRVPIEDFEERCRADEAFRSWAEQTIARTERMKRAVDVVT